MVQNILLSLVWLGLRELIMIYPTLKLLHWLPVERIQDCNFGLQEFSFPEWPSTTIILSNLVRSRARELLCHHLKAHVQTRDCSINLKVIRGTSRSYTYTSVNTTITAMSSWLSWRPHNTPIYSSLYISGVIHNTPIYSSLYISGVIHRSRQVCVSDRISWQ